ncbi:hypothetical protein BGZ61DRAFT_95389 [Ilyonectria robusta]|uniref:uncharacterized protein n=1 Tax=Ilyonectria robusta TaxID=1079257 RepID=UPI001E8ED9D0|nr:uncharacterized protein BGZ61DRAFT_95389 [Ilyonectria robusta]KAH8736484.1 hypothetical protein BGZ61DRAFT_95389 [Ilyonectria robusta]
MRLRWRMRAAVLRTTRNRHTDNHSTTAALERLVIDRPRCSGSMALAKKQRIIVVGPWLGSPWTLHWCPFCRHGSERWGFGLDGHDSASQNRNPTPPHLTKHPWMMDAHCRRTCNRRWNQWIRSPNPLQPVHAPLQPNPR